MAENRAHQGPPPRRAGVSFKEVSQIGHVLKRVLAYTLSKNKVKAVVVVCCILFSAFVHIVNSMFLRTLIDDYIIPLTHQAQPDFGPLAWRLVRLAVLFACGIIATYAYQRLMMYITQDTMLSLRKEVFAKMESLPIGYFDTHAHGDIMSVYTNDIDTLRQMVNQTIPQLLNSSVTIILAFISMLILNIPLTILTLVMVFIMIMMAGKLGGLSSKYFTKQQMALGKVNGYIEEMMGGQKVVKVFCHEEKAVEEFSEINEDLRASASRANKLASMLMPLNANVAYISYVLCAVLGSVVAISGFTSLTLGSLVSFLTLNRNFTMPVTQISMQLSAVVMAQAGAQRVFALLDETPEDDDGKVTLVYANEAEDGTLTEAAERTGVWAWKVPAENGGEPSYVKVRGGVRFEGVDFSYVPEKQILYDINMYAKPGQKIALVGSTGAGKTTITNLITRFYDIQRGQILYDGIDITDIKKSDLRRSLGVVLQDTNLFTGTVMDNIRFGRLDATDEEVIEAAKIANADGFIRRLPEGYHTMLTGNGANLSQGQRQLLSIARATIEDAPVLILDEATSSIDTRTEMHVQAGMDALMAGRTTFVIAHRLSTIMNANCIMVVEGGHIIERGDHDELIEAKGRYYQLYTGNAVTEG